MWKIGIVDDAKDERSDIQVSILDNAGVDSVEFKEYELENRSRDDILDEISEDVEKEEIHALIVDFRLDTTRDVIKGCEIIEFMNKEIPEFPVVILTNVPDESRESPFTDADKVYAKKVFLNPELPETKMLVNNIILNMRKYEKHREDLERSLEMKLAELDRNGSDEEILENIIQIENELGKYKPMDKSTLNTAFDMSDLRKAFQELEEYEKRFGANV